MSLIHRASAALLSHRPGGLAGRHRAVRPRPPPTPALRRVMAPPGCRGQLTDGLIHNPNFGGFDDYGLTARHRLRAARDRSARRRRQPTIRTRWRHHVDDYTTDAAFGTGRRLRRRDRQAARLRAGDRRRRRSFGGVNLVSGPRGPRRDRRPAQRSDPGLVDQSSFGDFANTIGQIFAVRGLLTAPTATSRAPGPEVPAAQQQCDKGYFRLDFAQGDRDQAVLHEEEPRRHRRDGARRAPSCGSTAHGHSALRRTALRARRCGWLRQPRSDKTAGVGGGHRAARRRTPTAPDWPPGPWVRTVVCHGGARPRRSWCEAPARRAEGRHPAGGPARCDRLRPGRPRRRPADGITDETQDQWRRATAQAAPGLLFLGARCCK